MVLFQNRPICSKKLFLRGKIFDWQGGSTIGTKAHKCGYERPRLVRLGNIREITRSSPGWQCSFGGERDDDHEDGGHRGGGRHH
ncbi:MAG: lasso RiPP family leader peptide-containing protein [Actinobacteria bacterium]|nr:lasso RiPP family leader peptide-containing protein [Actinomycetota bacterium]